ncbi:hypothetical protein [Streptomyces sp. NPDC056500]|uniref:hypothetical protein n=1 Tax=unclassified Streptomyces TaxID=2593676 RepID=UPI0036BA2BBE
MADVIQLNQRGNRSPFLGFAEQLVAKNDGLLFNYGAEEQVAMVLRAVERLHRISPLTPIDDAVIDLAGFGEAPLVYRAAADEPVEYLLLSDVAEALGWFMPRAHTFAEKMASLNLEDQRRTDEERGDGRLGWEWMRDYIRLDIDLVADDSEARPDVDGKRWSDYTDWLVSRDRLPALLTASPWSKEFMDNTMPAIGFAVREAWGDKLREILTYRTDGAPSGNAYDDLFPADGMTKEEALKRARRGPALD